MNKIFLSVILMSFVALTVSGCGIRPNRLVAPSEADQGIKAKSMTPYPTVYPKQTR